MPGLFFLPHINKELDLAFSSSGAHKSTFYELSNITLDSTLRNTDLVGKIRNRESGTCRNVFEYLLHDRSAGSLHSGSWF